jgi:hypothetical protein
MGKTPLLSAAKQLLRCLWKFCLPQGNPPQDVWWSYRLQAPVAIALPERPQLLGDDTQPDESVPRAIQESNDNAFSAVEMASRALLRLAEEHRLACKLTMKFDMAAGQITKTTFFMEQDYNELEDRVMLGTAVSEMINRFDFFLGDAASPPLANFLTTIPPARQLARALVAVNRRLEKSGKSADHFRHVFRSLLVRPWLQKVRVSGDVGEPPYLDVRREAFWREIGVAFRPLGEEQFRELQEAVAGLGAVNESADTASDKRKKVKRESRPRNLKELKNVRKKMDRDAKDKTQLESTREYVEEHYVRLNAEQIERKAANLVRYVNRHKHLLG